MSKLNGKVAVVTGRRRESEPPSPSHSSADDQACVIANTRWFDLGQNRAIEGSSRAILRTSDPQDGFLLINFNERLNLGFRLQFEF